jgi:hypothetical protein
MNINEMIEVRGCITQERYIKGRSLAQLEQLLGFAKGRLDNGIIVAALIQLPNINQFQLLGYTQVAEHKFKGIDPKKLDENKLKELVLKEAFTLVGYKRLVKVIANTPHNAKVDNDTQYPPGQGIPQWKLTSALPARVTGIVTRGKAYF